MGLLEALKQYASDAAGGSLNPEVGNTLSGLLNYGKDRARYIGGLLDDNSQINQDFQGWHKRTQLGLADLIAGREGPQADYAHSQIMNMAGVAPLGILRNTALQDAAIKHFGTTYSPRETGFLLDNGKRLDLSGRHYATGYQRQGDKFVPIKDDYLAGNRAVDHRELGDLVPGEGWTGLSDFMNQTGAVRYMPEVGVSVVDTNMPNVTQIQKAVEDFRRSRTPMNVDVDTFSGSSRASQEFERPTVDAVMEWIKSQMKPEAFK